jgi:branched-chain amino acid transport system permease protein
MFDRILSNDYPRSRVLAIILIVLLLALAFTPFVF